MTCWDGRGGFLNLLPLQFIDKKGSVDESESEDVHYAGQCSYLILYSAMHISNNYCYKIVSPHQFEGAGWKIISYCPISEHHFLGRLLKSDGVNPTKPGPYA